MLLGTLGVDHGGVAHGVCGNPVGNPTRTIPSKYTSTSRARHGGASGMATGAAMQCNMPRLRILASLFVKIGSPFVVFHSVQRPGTPRCRGGTSSGIFADFKLRERTADSSTLGPISAGTYLQ